MGDDSDNDWLKKKPVCNPIRMSLRRSQRFFPRSPDMDASLISNHGKPSQQSLAVPRIIRRTSVNLERLKEMKFKVPALPVSSVQEKVKAKGSAPAKRQTMGIPRPYGGIKARQSTIGTGLRSNPRASQAPIMPKSAEIKQPSQPTRPSFHFGPRKSGYVPASASRKPNIVQRLVKLSESCAKYDSERSILESSRIMNQSTPNDPSGPRSILKQTQSGTKRQLAWSRSKQESTDKPKAAKKVNFNEKENAQEVKPEEEIHNNHDFAALEESTIAFTDAFKPIAFEEPKVVPEPVPVPINVPLSVPVPDVKISDFDAEKFHKEFVTEIIDSFEAKWEEYNVCHEKLKSLRQAFASEIQKKSQFDSNESLLNKFCLYKAKRDDILENFKRIDRELDQIIKNKTDIRPELEKYMKEEEVIQRELSDVHVKFKQYTESLKSTKQPPVEEFKHPPKKLKESPNDKLKKVSDRSKAIKKQTGGRYNSKKKTAIYNDLQQSLNLDPLGSSPDELANTPDNTPAKRRRLSKKIQRQLNTLFEDE